MAGSPSAILSESFTLPLLVNDDPSAAAGEGGLAVREPNNTATMAGGPEAARINAELVARLERLPVTRRLGLIRIIIGSATFFDAYTVLAIAFAMPQLVTEWHLSAGEIGMILSAGYVGQIFGSLFFGHLAERIGRLPVLLITILLFVSMDIGCLFAWGAWSMIILRFLQGIGTGGEVPVASAYINEFIGAKKRGRFFLLYEVIFPVGLMFAGIAGYFLVPVFGWKAMFIVGLIPAVLTIPMRALMPESPRWLASTGRVTKADAVVSMLENEALKAGATLPEPVVRPVDAKATARSDWRELFKGIYRKRTFTIWFLWICVYMVNNGLITWLPTLYKQAFNLPLQTSLAYGWVTSAVGVIAPSSAPCSSTGSVASAGTPWPSSPPPFPSSSSRPWEPSPRHRSSCSPALPTPSSKPSLSRFTSTPRSSTRPAFGPSAPASAAPGSAPDPLWGRCSSDGSSTTSASATSSPCSPQ
ncbi:putative metabolite transport protein YyaJ [Arthrobacter sp. Hiyo6]|nr:putative metabolite transport protein YyaJ [Arthrobacter sp. Hiyo6]